MRHQVYIFPHVLFALLISLLMGMLVGSSVKAQVQGWQNYYAASVTDGTGIYDIESHQGEIWYTSSRGLHRFDPESGRVRTYDETNTSISFNRSGISWSYISHIQSDAHTGKLWFITKDQQLGYYDGREWHLYNPRNFPDMEVPFGLLHHLGAGNGQVWLSSDSLVVAQFDGTTWKRHHFLRDAYDWTAAGMAMPEIADLKTTDDGSVWLAVYDYIDPYLGDEVADGKLVRIQPNGQYQVYDSTNAPIPTTGVMNLALGPEGSMFFTTDSGVVYFKGGNFSTHITGEIRTQLAQYDWRDFSIQTMVHNTHKMGVDRNGALWLIYRNQASSSYGLFRYQNGSLSWINSVTAPIPQQLEDIDLDEAGNLWVCGKGSYRAAGGSLVSYHVDGNWALTDLAASNTNTTLPSPDVQAMATETREDGKLVYWFGTTDGAAALVEDRWYNVVFPSGWYNVQPGVSDVEVDGEHNKWFLSEARHQYQYQYSTKQILSMYDNYGWVTFNNSNSPFTWENDTVVNGDSRTITEEYMIDIESDAAGNLWLLTEGGWFEERYEYDDEVGRYIWKWYPGAYSQTLYRYQGGLDWESWNSSERSDFPVRDYYRQLHSTPDGSIWLQGSESFLQFRNDAFAYHDMNNLPIPDLYRSEYSVEHFTHDQAGTPWLLVSVEDPDFVHRDYLLRWNESGWWERQRTLQDEDTYAEEILKDVYFDTRNQIWFLTDYMTHGHAALINDSMGDRFSIQNSPLISDWIHRVQFDVRNNLWFLTDRGVSVYNDSLYNATSIARFDPNRGRVLQTIDYNKDDREDLIYVNDDNAFIRLYRNDSTDQAGNIRFSDVTELLGLSGVDKHGDIFTMDYDNDGQMDIFQRKGLQLRALVNEEESQRFVDQSEELGLGAYYPTEEVFYSGVISDFDLDGWGDILASAASTSANGKTAARKRRRIFSTTRTFRKTGGETAFGPPVSIIEDLDTTVVPIFVTIDFDNDSDDDLLILNYDSTRTRDLHPISLYRNDRDTFINVTETSRLGQVSHHGFATVWDYNNDGWLDLLIGSSNGRNIVYRNDGDGGFTDVSSALNLQKGQYIYEQAAVIDYDNDGDFDVCWSVKGHPNSAIMLFINNFGVYEERSRVSNLNLQAPAGTNTKWFDMDQDGDLDLFAYNPEGESWLIRNTVDVSSGQYLRVVLEGCNSTLEGIGARVVVHLGAKRLTQYMSGRVGSNDLTSKVLHFGLGNIERIDSVVVHWPGGHRTRVPAPRMNTVYTLAEDPACDRTTDNEDPGVHRDPSARQTQLEVYPNPTSGQVNLQFSAPVHETGQVQVVNLLGHAVYASTISEGVSTLSLDLGHLPRGTYILRCRVGTERQYTRIVLQ